MRQAVATSAVKRLHFFDEFFRLFSHLKVFVTVWPAGVRHKTTRAGPGYQNLSRGPDWKWPNREARGAMF